MAQLAGNAMEGVEDADVVEDHKRHIGRLGWAVAGPAISADLSAEQKSSRSD